MGGRYAYYDWDADIVWLSAGQAEHVVSEGMPWGTIDHDEVTGAVVAIEIRNASTRLPVTLLSALPGPRKQGDPARPQVRFVRAFYDRQADLVAIDLNEPGDAVDAIDVGRATVLVDADGAPRSIEIVGVDRRGAAEAITAVVARWPKLDRPGLLAAANAARAAPDREITVSSRVG